MCGHGHARKAPDQALPAGCVTQSVCAFFWKDGLPVSKSTQGEISTAPRRGAEREIGAIGSDVLG